MAERDDLARKVEPVTLFPAMSGVEFLDAGVCHCSGGSGSGSGGTCMCGAVNGGGGGS